MTERDSHNEDTSGNVLCVLGSGVVEGAWSPVIRAVASIGAFASVRNAEQANFAMARLVSQARWFCSSRLARTDDHWRSARDNCISVLKTVCSRISEELSEAERLGQLRTRPEFEGAIEDYAVRDCQRVGFATTNWDRTVEHALLAIRNDFDVAYLHGSIHTAPRLYLPAEVADEPYRTEEERTEFETANASFINAAGVCEKVVLYGLSLAPLDAELAWLFEAGTLGSPLKEVVIVDIAPGPVAERVAVLLGGESRPPVDIWCCSPSNRLAGAWKRYESNEREGMQSGTQSNR